MNKHRSVMEQMEGETENERKKGREEKMREINSREEETVSQQCIMCPSNQASYAGFLTGDIKAYEGKI